MSQQPGHNRPQQNPQGLFDSLQAEIAPEASPLLEFLKKHTGAIILCFTALVLIIAGYLYYTHKSHSANLAQQQELGKLLVIANPEARFTSLENYLADAPAVLRNQTMLAMLQTAVETGKTEKVLELWEKLGKEDKNLSQLSAIGTASALAESGKYAEALAIHEGLLPQVSASERPFINRSILNYAEVLGDTARAIKACEDILAEMPKIQMPVEGSEELKLVNAERSLLEQKLAMLRLKAE